jgi:hypothetical protein
LRRRITDEAQEEREAVGLLHFLYSMPLRKVDVLDAVKSAPAVRPRVRQMALSLAARFQERAGSKEFHDAAWPVIRHPYANAFTCRFAVAQMNAACGLAPDAGYRLGLGVAQYRLGRFERGVTPRHWPR